MALKSDGAIRDPANEFRSCLEMMSCPYKAIDPLLIYSHYTNCCSTTESIEMYSTSTRTLYIQRMKACIYSIKSSDVLCVYGHIASPNKSPLTE